MKRKALFVFLILAYKLNAWQDLDIKQERLYYLVKEKNPQYTLHMEQVKLDEVVCYKITRTAKINQKNFQDQWLLEKPSMRLRYCPFCSTSFPFWIYQREPFYLVKFEGYKDIFPPSKQIIELKEILK